MKIKVSDYIAYFLCRNGIKDVFTVTGGGAMHLNDSLGHCPDLKCTYNHHEQACAIAAEAYARLSGEPACVCVTSGPGGTNALTGVVGGWLDSVPMFILSGQVKRETTVIATDVPLRQLGDQEYTIIDTVKPMTKYAVMVNDESKIAYHLEKALYLAMEGRRGPVWLDIPLDIQGASVDTENLEHFSPGEFEEKTYDISDETAQAIIEKISNAKRPVILAGSGIRFSKSDAIFNELIEKLRIPVVVAWNSNDLVPYDSPYFCGMPGTVGTRSGNFVVQNADVLLVLGSRLNIRMISYNKFDFAKNAYKIIVDIDENELKKPTIVPDMPVCADVKCVIEKLLKTDYGADHSEWLSWCKNLLVRYPVVQPKFYENTAALNPYVFIDELFRRLKSNDTICCSNGSACVVTFQAAKTKAGQRMFTNSGCASMGYGLPAAIGAAVYKKDECIICLEGDGSLMMNLQELQTVFHNRYNIKIFILNNNGYHSIRQTQTNLFSPPLVGVCADNGVSFPSFEKIAYAFDIPYEKVASLDDADKIQHVLEMDGPVICEAFLDYSQNFEPKLSSKVLDDGRIVSPSIDDMFPFLPKEEYESNHF
ncbi:MAG: thiamine pyrophosphate-binding protein [Clostridia bacterium]|nr:thiamine pyrophosphate-binding protein [Clostridia bacterium]